MIHGTLYSAIYNDFYPFDKMGLFDDFQVVRNGHQLERPGMLVVWGGEDISPSLYNKAVSTRTWADDRPSTRDRIEWELMKAAVDRGMPIIGICRGAQMLCALNGGFLIQDVDNHGRSHDVEVKEGFTIEVNSLHHQMMYPFDVEHEVIAKTPSKISGHFLDVDEFIDVPFEPEFVYFPKTKGIAIQWHPEMMDFSCEANEYLQKYLKHYENHY